MMPTRIIFRSSMLLLIWIAWALNGETVRAQQETGVSQGAQKESATPDSLSKWKHRGSVFTITTPEGADLADSVELEQFPLLIRLHRDWFVFSQAQPDGRDLRFALADDTILSMQIDQWNPEAGEASIWVRMPLIRGNAQQELKVFWGNASAEPVSDGKAVFNETNGYLGVWHMNDVSHDETQRLKSIERGMSTAKGVIGASKHLAGGEGIFGGENILDYPTGDATHSTEAWFRAEKPNSTIIGWGNEGGGRGSKVRMQLRSPPHIHIDSDFSDVKGESTLELNEWIHVVHTYERENGKIYINGQLDAASNPLLDIKRPSRLWLGGWYHQYDFVGDLDEVRVSQVARSADWIRLQYANQNPKQLVVGPIVPAGNEFRVSPMAVTVSEGSSVPLVAKAGGARKLIWTLLRDGQEAIVAVDRLNHLFVADRVTEDRTCVLKLKAIYEHESKTIEIPIHIQESIAEPAFTLNGPHEWNGRTTIEINANVSNLTAMNDANAADLEYRWQVSGMAVIKDIQPGKLLLQRSLNSGDLVVNCSISNGGTPSNASHRIHVREPDSDAWQVRTPSAEERPVDNQFYARDDQNQGTLYCNGKLDEDADRVFIKVLADGKDYFTETRELDDRRSYSFAVKLKPGLIRYTFEMGTIREGTTKVVHKAANLICGDAFLISGQSNALATDWGPEPHDYSSEWIRSFGSNHLDPTIEWNNAVPRGQGKSEIGCWGMELARNLVERHQMPICIINGAVGGTLLEAHQRNDTNPSDPSTLYGRLLDRIQRANLTHGIRGAFWYQGENNQGAQGATGKYGWETYESLFLEMVANWKRDYPNLQHTFVFQIWPNSCSMGGTDASDRLRDIQRQLPKHFSHMTAVSTLGIKPEGSCHFPPAGYIALAKQILPMVEQVHYGKSFDNPVTSANIKQAFFTSDRQDEIALEFDQGMAWSDTNATEFYLDGQPSQVSSGKAEGNSIKLKLVKPSNAKSISYLLDKRWNPDNLLLGKNQLAALTFFEVPIKPLDQ
jgi:hypothetical protein